MKTKLNILISIFTGIFLAGASITAHEIRNSKNAIKNSEALYGYSVQAFDTGEIDTATKELVATPQASPYENAASEAILVDTAPAANIYVDPNNSTKQDSTKNIIASRGVAPTPPKNSTEKPIVSDTTIPKTELLDWWKEAQFIFARDSIATVKDVYTGKTFKVKRTMGTNHADSEALTLKDTETIKSIWGGFSWDRRPVHVYINGRVLAASMSAMPHAGLDSAPAYAYVNNRSDGYGSGENLDVIKNNGMDGHFDIHFLNSTRHKDGKIDPEHQKMIKIAAQK
jgi:hypothetical protein